MLCVGAIRASLEPQSTVYIIDVAFVQSLALLSFNIVQYQTAPSQALVNWYIFDDVESNNPRPVVAFS